MCVAFFVALPPVGFGSCWSYASHPISPELPLAGVPSNADDDAVGYSKSELAKDMASKYLPFDLDCPGMKVHSVDPPILTIDGFLDDADCDALMAETPSILQSSTIGAGKLEGSQGVELSQRRTSSSVLLDQVLMDSAAGGRQFSSPLPPLTPPTL